eukprot:CAMPEP_0197539982 /NCGR_PEP_ID=MMETSP1318-20131121/64379_1 /TAXON_ID=552666 /ORGANISM="Partenskyella glossopodia, Strain RCC365" /LENGTH=276 /DNA_ID=CAMNT_0043098847 /DNA_START=264 /DNA_END=1095 /DNA_ORIENTATION=-
MRHTFRGLDSRAQELFGPLQLPSDIGAAGPLPRDTSSSRPLVRVELRSVAQLHFVGAVGHRVAHREDVSEALHLQKVVRDEESPPVEAVFWQRPLQPLCGRSEPHAAVYNVRFQSTAIPECASVGVDLQVREFSVYNGIENQVAAAPPKPVCSVSASLGLERVQQLGEHVGDRDLLVGKFGEYFTSKFHPYCSASDDEHRIGSAELFVLGVPRRLAVGQRIFSTRSFDASGVVRPTSDKKVVEGDLSGAAADTTDFECSAVRIEPNGLSLHEFVPV